MVSKEQATKVLHEALKTDCDFAELFYEDTISNTLEMNGKEVTKANCKNIYGVGLRLLKDEQEVYGYINEDSDEALLKLVNDLSQSFNGENQNISFELQYEDMRKHHLAKIKEISNEKKVSYLQRVSKSVKFSNGLFRGDYANNCSTY